MAGVAPGVYQGKYLGPPINFDAEPATSAAGIWGESELTQMERTMGMQSDLELTSPIEGDILKAIGVEQ